MRFRGQLDDPNVLVLDVRGDDEYQKGAIPGARNIYTS
ncbi:hypothetical protein NIES1031_19655 [Chroogloeocystis siderophila 5.2 s.c.1]|uniref:Rhodanese domain-containing protein n=1 Tax=Chroogloeocystis siderophila 5.2 s.c.1 TaxID=247279 RepID=A0A1U7HGE7_9CHRO|nr:hypothetical protein NIES1031_19655 [Chroogloeocystis siderophila 5.2 s.c.1]